MRIWRILLVFAVLLVAGVALAAALHSRGSKTHVGTLTIESTTTHR